MTALTKAMPATIMVAISVGLKRIGGRFPTFENSHNIANFPKALGHLGGHRRCGPQRLMDANEIVVHRKQRDRMGMVLDLLEKAFVSRVKRRVCIRRLRFERSAYDVLM